MAGEGWPAAVNAGRGLTGSKPCTSAPQFTATTAPTPWTRSARPPPPLQTAWASKRTHYLGAGGLAATRQPRAGLNGLELSRSNMFTAPIEQGSGTYHDERCEAGNRMWLGGVPREKFRGQCAAQVEIDDTLQRAKSPMNRETPGEQPSLNRTAVLQHKFCASARGQSRRPPRLHDFPLSYPGSCRRARSRRV